jgi:oligopeptide/dipeptide ABC transporter ATP-binding protein
MNVDGTHATDARLTPATGGSVLLRGQDITKASVGQMRRLRSELQMVFQDPFSSFDPTAQLGESIAEPLIAERLGESERRERAAALLEQVGLDPAFVQRYPSQLSGGQLQRAAIARALAPDPKLVILDEPVSALDLSTQAQIINLLKDLQESMSPAYLFVAHDLAVVRHVSHRVAVMYKGRIVEEGPTEAVYRAPRHPYTVALLQSMPGRHRVRVVRTRSSVSTADGGCRFAARCEHRMQVCTDVDPALMRVDDDVSVACHLFDADRVEASHVTGRSTGGASAVTVRVDRNLSPTPNA